MRIERRGGWEALACWSLVVVFAAWSGPQEAALALEPDAQGVKSPYKIGWAGFGVGKATRAELGSAGLPEGTGVFVRSVIPGGPAAEAGLKPGDVLLRHDTALLSDPRTLAIWIKENPGASLNLTIGREGREEKLTLRVGVQQLSSVIERMLASALPWLAAEQQKDGGWPGIHSSVMGHERPSAPPNTGIAVLALLAAPPALREKNAQTIERGITYLLTYQGPDGAIGMPEEVLQLKNFLTSLTLQACLGFDRARYEHEIAQMVKFLETNQLDEHHGFARDDWRYGGWNFFESLDQKSGDRVRVDLCVARFVTDALKAANISLDHPLWEKSALHVTRCQNWQDTADRLTIADDGGFISSPRFSKAGPLYLGSDRVRFRSYGSATSDGLKVLLNQGFAKDDPRVRSALRWISGNFTVTENPGFPADSLLPFGKGLYYYYLMSVADTLRTAGEERITTPDGREHYWIREIVDQLSMLQKPEGYWKNRENAMTEDDPLLATSLSALALGDAWAALQGRK